MPVFNTLEDLVLFDIRRNHPGMHCSIDSMKQDVYGIIEVKWRISSDPDSNYWSLYGTTVDALLVRLEIRREHFDDLMDDFLKREKASSYKWQDEWVTSILNSLEDNNGLNC